MDIYRVEKEQAVREGVLDKVFLALSREKGQDKVNIVVFSRFVPTQYFQYYRTILTLCDILCTVSQISGLSILKQFSNKRICCWSRILKLTDASTGFIVLWPGNEIHL